MTRHFDNNSHQKVPIFNPHPFVTSNIIQQAINHFHEARNRPTVCTYLELYLDVLDGLQLVLVLLGQELQLLLQPLTHVLHVAALVLRPRQRALQVRQLRHRLDLLLQHPRQRFLQHTQNSWI